MRASETDLRADVEGEVRLAVDRASAPLLEGTVIDLPAGPSFRFANPRARKSFRVSC